TGRGKRMDAPEKAITARQSVERPEMRLVDAKRCCWCHGEDKAVDIAPRQLRVGERAVSDTSQEVGISILRQPRAHGRLRHAEGLRDRCAPHARSAWRRITVPACPIGPARSMAAPTALPDACASSSATAMMRSRPVAGPKWETAPPPEPLKRGSSADHPW